MHLLMIRYLLIFLCCPVLSCAQIREERALFKAGTGGYHTYRIPSLLTTPQGTVLAFCEGRKQGQSDTGDIDLLLRRSTDGGQTWGETQVVWDDGQNVCGNPCAVVDTTSGTIFLLMTWNRGDDPEAAIVRKESQDTRRVYLTQSQDEGLTWSTPEEITEQVKKPGWGWYATGPGVGLQIKHGPHRGRLLIPANHSYDDPQGKVREGPFSYGAHVFYSDDHGKSWQLGGVIRPEMNESQVSEVADGRGTLLMNMRSYAGLHRRAYAVSQDGGASWSGPQALDDLVEPVCQASVVRYDWPGLGQRSTLLFSNPADSLQRQNMTIKLSYDEGLHWPVQRTLYEGPAAYSCLAVLPNGLIGCLYERGEDSFRETITLSVFDKAWLLSAEAVEPEQTSGK